MTKTETLLTLIAIAVLIGATLLMALITIFLPIVLYNELGTPEVQAALAKVPKWQLQVIAYIGLGLLISLFITGGFIIIQKTRGEEV